jgi:hypothetical protein
LGVYVSTKTPEVNDDSAAFSPGADYGERQSAKRGYIQTRIHNLLICCGRDDAGSSTAGMSRDKRAAADEDARVSRKAGEAMTISLNVNGSH